MRWHHILCCVWVSFIPVDFHRTIDHVCRGVPVAAVRRIKSNTRGNRHVGYGTQHLITSFNRILASCCVCCLGVFIPVDFHGTIGQGCDRSATVAAARRIESNASGNLHVDYGAQPLSTFFDCALVSFCRTCLFCFHSR